MAAAGSGWRRLERTIVGVQRRAPLLQLVAVGVTYWIAVLKIQGFGGRSSIVDILVLAAFTGVASIGQTLAAILGGLDLSIPAVIGAANIAICQLTGANGWSFPLAAAAVIGTAAAVGGLNGFLSQRFGIHSLLVTIGSGAVIAGLISAWTGGASTAAAPGWLGNITSPGRGTGPIPVPPIVLIWAAISVAVLLMMQRTIFGHRIYAAGSNARAARLARVDLTRVWTATFALSSVCAAVAGILLAGFTGSGLFTVGEPYLFNTIACVVVGGTSLLGGRGDYGRTVLGAILLTELTTLFIGFGVSAPTQQVVLGALIIVIVAAYGREPHVRNRI